MLAFLTALCGVVASVFNYLTKGIIGLATTIYRDYFSPSIKRKKEAKKRADEAIDKGDRKGLLDAINDYER